MQVRSTREQLLHTLRIRGLLTILELSAELGIGSTAVRQHLDRLQAEGYVEIVGRRRGSGRPRHIFDLTPQADDYFPQSYDRLTLDILEAIHLLPEGEELLSRTLKALQHVWEERYSSQMTNKTLLERVAALTDILNERGNMAEYEQQTDGSFLLSKHNCTLRRVSAHYPQICRQERLWFERALGTRVKTIKSLSTGDHHCVFCIMPQEEQP